MNRRQFLTGLGAAAGAGLLYACSGGRASNTSRPTETSPGYQLQNVEITDHLLSTEQLWELYSNYDRAAANWALQRIREKDFTGGIPPMETGGTQVQIDAANIFTYDLQTAKGTVPVSLLLTNVPQLRSGAEGLTSYFFDQNGNLMVAVDMDYGASNALKRITSEHETIHFAQYLAVYKTLLEMGLDSTSIAIEMAQIEQNASLQQHIDEPAAWFATCATIMDNLGDPEYGSLYNRVSFMSSNQPVNLCDRWEQLYGGIENPVFGTSAIPDNSFYADVQNFYAATGAR